MINRLLLVIVVMLATIKITAASSTNKTTQKPDVFVRYVIFFGQQKQKLNSDAITKQCDFGGIEKLSDFNSFTNKPSIIVKRQGLDLQPLPSMQALRFFGRGFDQSNADRLLASDYSISLTGIGPFDKNHLLLKKITRCVDDIAKKHNAFVYDVSDSLTFTSVSFSKIRGQEITQDLLSTSQFGVRAYRVKRGIRSVSMGLGKFGQPNLVIENFSEHHMGYIDKLFTVVLQHVIESHEKALPGIITIDVNKISNPIVRQKYSSFIKLNGKGKAKIQLRKTKSLKGDPANLLSIHFENSPGEGLWNEQAKLLKSVFGKDRDISNTSSSTNLQAAIASAKKRAKAILAKGYSLKKDGSRLLVAVALKRANEVVWVEVLKWEGSRGKGILQSNPIYTKSLKSGMKYNFNYASIMDFILYGPDGQVVEKGGVDELARKVGYSR